MQDKWSQFSTSLQDSYNGASKEQKWVLGAAAGVTGVALLAKLATRSSAQKKPSTWEVLWQLQGLKPRKNAIFPRLCALLRVLTHATPNWAPWFKHFCSQLTGGSIARDSVAKEFKQYSSSYGADGSGTGITDRERTVQLVDVFYSLVTDIYEWCVGGGHTS
jgi:hypothetical protein